MKTYIVMPVANEEKTVGRLLAEIRMELPEVAILVVMDKFSRDRTAEIVQRMAAADPWIHRFSFTRSTGFASCYLYGFRRVIAEGDPDAPIIEMDAGGSHSPDRLPFLRAQLDRHACVFSTRFARGGGFVNHPWHRRALSWGGTQLANRLFLGTSLSDMTSGFEGFRSGVLRAIDRKIGFDNFLSLRPGCGHFFQTEMRYYCSKLDICEVPILYRGSGSTLKASAVWKSLAALYELGCRPQLAPGDL